MDSKVEIFVLTFHVQILHVFLNVHVLYCIVLYLHKLMKSCVLCK